PRQILFEFEKRRRIWSWLAPVGVAAALIIAVVLTAPIHVEWHDSQLTINVGAGLTPARDGVKPAPTPQFTQPAAQPIDYNRIAKQIETSQRAWLIEELKKHDAEQAQQFRRVQGRLAFVEEQQQVIARENVDN